MIYLSDMKLLNPLLLLFSKGRSFFLAVTAIALLSVPAAGQRFRFTNYNDLNGLPSSETYSTLQDSSGFIWIGTDNGVAKFDGQEFVIFNRSSGLTDNTVFGFHEDTGGRIWFRTFSGAISYHENGAIRQYRHNLVLRPVLGSSVLNKIIVEDNRLWFSTNGQGPAGLVDSVGNVTLLENQIGYDAPAYLFVYRVEGGEYLTGFTGTPKFLTSIHIDGKNFPVEIDPDFLNSAVAQCVSVGKSLYLAINKQLFRYDGTSVETMATFERPVINLSLDKSSDLWVGFFGGGVRRYSPERFDRYFTIRELEQNSVSSTLEDNEGGYWFTTLDRGVFHFPNLEIAIDDHEGTQKISAVVRTRDAIYTGNYAGQVIRMLHGSTQSELIFEDSAPISAMYEDRRGNIWWSSAQGCFMLTRSGTITRRSELQSVRGFFTNPKGQVCAHNSTTAYAFDRNMNPVTSVELSARPIKVLTADSVIYNGSLSGLERYDANFLPMDMTMFYEGRIASLEAADRNLVLAGTIGNGLLMVDGGQKHIFNSRNGLVAANVYTIMVLDEEVWLGTEKGIMIASKEALRKKAPSWKRITMSSGLLSDKCNFMVHTNDEVIVFSDQGRSILPKGVATFLNERPHAYIKTILVNNQPEDLVVGELEPNRNNVSIDIGVISFNNRELMHRHRLSRDAAWNMGTGRNISYYNLNPGNYNIEVSASTDGVNWYSGSQVVSIRINEPWWSSWTFIVAVAILVMLTSWLIYLLRVNAIKRKQVYLEIINSHQQRLIDSEIRTTERERKRIATDLHDGVGTALSSIKLMIADSVKARDGERDQRVNEINENLTDVIAEIRRIVYDLRPPALERYGLQVGLKNLAEKINNHGGVSVMCDYYGQREVSPQVSITVYRIVQELINNTLKHAKATEIRIHINQFDDEMNMMYEDNGIGMIGSRFNGLGLYSIESRVRSLSGRMTWESNHKGTFYNFDIPY
jgi:signal transduction histidine kinase/ligand-binding sensor domain-containing protein